MTTTTSRETIAAMPSIPESAPGMRSVCGAHSDRHEQRLKCDYSRRTANLGNVLAYGNGRTRSSWLGVHKNRKRRVWDDQPNALASRDRAAILAHCSFFCFLDELADVCVVVLVFALCILGLSRIFCSLLSFLELSVLVYVLPSASILLRKGRWLGAVVVFAHHYRPAILTA